MPNVEEIFEGNNRFRDIECHLSVSFQSNHETKKLLKIELIVLKIIFPS